MIKELTKGQIRESCMKELEMRNIECWITNNLAVPGRKFIGRRGVADVLGFHKVTGVMVGLEIKTLGDRLSDAQRDFLRSLRSAGGFALLGVQIGDQAKIIDYTEE